MENLAEEYERILRKNAGIAGLDEDGIQRILGGMSPLLDSLEKHLPAPPDKE